jgi:hypothetical protein
MFDPKIFPQLANGASATAAMRLEQVAEAAEGPHRRLRYPTCPR